MLTLDDSLHIPAHVSYSVVGDDVFLLDTRHNKYYALDEVGARFWGLLSQGVSLRACYDTLLAEYDVDPLQLEADLLELVNNLAKNGLVEIIT